MTFPIYCGKKTFQTTNQSWLECHPINSCSPRQPILNYLHDIHLLVSHARTNGGKCGQTWWALDANWCKNRMSLPLDLFHSWLLIEHGWQWWFCIAMLFLYQRENKNPAARVKATLGSLIAMHGHAWLCQMTKGYARWPPPDRCVGSVSIPQLESYHIPLVNPIAI